jgi:hypothetical protein
VETHRATEPEGRLLAYYSATMAFSPLGELAARTRWTFAVEATYIPKLNENQRRASIDKPETTNLAPVLPRPRLTVRAPLGFVIEGSWVPPVRVADATLNLFGAAVSRTVATWRGIDVTPRLSAVTGRARGAITCSKDATETGEVDLAVYYANVCHGNDSDDWFEPRQLAGEVVLSRPFATTRGSAYVAAGGRIDRTRLDIGVQRDDGTRDTDHPIVKLRDTRPHVAAGARWSIRSGVHTAAEWFYAPGSISTLRLLVGLGGGR